MKNADSKILIALIKDNNDFIYLFKYGWYRIPTKRIKSVPKMVIDGSIKYIGFYQGKIFGEDGFQVRYYSKVKNVKIVERNELFPNELYNDKTYDKYYKIEIEDLIKLEKPILSKKRRIIIFINSNMKKFLSADEINDLYLGSSIEEKLWKELKKNMIPAEREFHEKIKSFNYFIDFALFCKNIKLAIECDGDAYHLSEKDVKYDKIRDNNLKSKGWNVLRYTTYDINQDLNNVIYQVKESINRYGGIDKNIENTEEELRFFKLLNKNQDQSEMF